jgi:hypothetical protein
MAVTTNMIERSSKLLIYSTKQREITGHGLVTATTVSYTNGAIWSKTVIATAHTNEGINLIHHTLNNKLHPDLKQIKLIKTQNFIS